MNRVAFVNGSGSKAQVSVVIGASTSNFQIEPGASDDNTRAGDGESVSFWWRNDGTPCRNCASTAPPCSRNGLRMGAAAMTVRLGDPQWPKQTL
jgi:hypothetical protein